MRNVAWVLSLLVLGCGGKIDGGTDSGADAASESVIIDCTPDLASCVNDSDCCSGLCATGDGLCGCVTTSSTGCSVDSDCCNAGAICVNGVCQ